MPRTDNPPKTIGELIDQLDMIREDLLDLQRSLERIEPQPKVTNARARIASKPSA
jgi:hypothetical protein